MESKICCPKCGSDQITANQHGYSAGKAVAGAVLTGGIGLLAGMHGSKKVDITCLACGNKFKPGQGKIVNTNPTNTTYIQPAKPVLDDSQMNLIEQNTLNLLTNSNVMAAMKYYTESTGLAPMNAADKLKELASNNDLLVPKVSSMKAFRKGQEEEMQKAEQQNAKNASIFGYVIMGVFVVILILIIRACVS
ncbi:MAG: hypothetical protein Q7T79_02205 [bacterium]|nr:hypothetical protein [bacterium]